MGSGAPPPPLIYGPPPYARRAPRGAEQSLPYRDCSGLAWWKRKIHDPEFNRWDGEVARLRKERKDKLEAWLDDQEEQTGHRPTSWIRNPLLLSDESQAALNLGIKEPEWPCAPPGYMYMNGAPGKEVWISRPRDPLILDLNGDGIQTISIEAGVYFDHNGDGFAEQTAWVGPDDGVLVLDRNGDGFINSGNELFGIDTILADGTKAANGFEALAELDDNKDGKIDSFDPGFWLLEVVKGFEENGYQTYTLDELGIDSINLSSTISGITDPQGNTQVRVGSFGWADGRTGTIAEYEFPTDRWFAMPVEWYDVPEDIAVLPELQGAGKVYDLHQAMARDASGQLKSLVEQFRDCTDPDTRNGLMEQILLKWTGSEYIEPYSRGGNIDARKLAALECWFDGPWNGVEGSAPNYAPAVYLNEAYRQVF